MAWLRASSLHRRSGEPVETQPGRKAETDRVCEGISEGFRLAESERVAPVGEGRLLFARLPSSFFAGMSPHPLLGNAFPHQVQLSPIL